MAVKRERSGLAGIVSQKELVEKIEAEEQAMDEEFSDIDFDDDDE